MKPLSVLVSVSAVLAGTVCGASRISGTYVAHGPKFAEMLQLTQTDNGQVSGVLSSVELKNGGSIISDQTPIKGVVDGGQLMLTVRSGLLEFLGATGNLSGTVTANTIRFQWVDSKGNVKLSAFVRGTPDQFKTYADQLRSKAAIIVANAKLLKGAQEFRETVRNAESWITNADMHAERIPNVKAAYETIETRMRSLVAQEHSQPSGSVARAQLSVAVGQGDIAGGQIDIQVTQTWEFGIEQPGGQLYKDFTNWDGNCENPDQLRKRGLAPHAIEAWESACKQAMAERQKFIPIFKRIMEQAAQLKALQSTAAANRRSLVHEANQIEYARAQ